jgi:acyl-coenzyme A thioesterase PaaI-like protein
MLTFIQENDMNVTEIPYNKFVGIKRAGKSEYLLELDESDDYLNHLGNVHAGAQLSLAEAASGEYLLQMFEDSASKFIPVVRRMESKFKKPAKGKVFARAKTSALALEIFKEELKLKGRSLIGVEVNIEDANHVVTMSAVVEWYVQEVIN